MTTGSEHDLIRVSRGHLRRRLRAVLAPELVTDIVRDLEAHPEGEVRDLPVTDYDRELAARSMATPPRKRRRA